MNSGEVRQKYLDFFKARNHRVISSGRLVPENDPTTLFTGSGMQPLIPYLLGEKHPEGNCLTNSQKCFRAEDMDEVGDNRHTTFFEMLGNWSLGEYFKQEQLEWAFEFFTDVLGIDPSRLYVTVFLADENNNIPQDLESVGVWKKLFAKKGIVAKDVELDSLPNASKVGMQGGRIFYYNATKNWWSRTGLPENMPVGEPGGPDSEVFYEFTDIEHDPAFGKFCHPNCDCGRFMEIGNSVFMEYRKNQDGGFDPLAQRNVDYGGGLERVTAAANNNADIFCIDTLGKIIESIEKATGIGYLKSDTDQKQAFRVIADHMRASIFLIGDGVVPSNVDQGYILRRLIRRAVRYGRKLDIQQKFLSTLVKPVIQKYEEVYPELSNRKEDIIKEISDEEEKFSEALSRGLKEFEKIVARSTKAISGTDAFVLFTSYGFPFEMTRELANERGLTVDEVAFKKEFENHQKLSKAGLEKKFHGGLADDSWECTKMHTATHLLHATLRNLLGTHVYQKGSNITSERLRFDFSHPEALTKEQIISIEETINKIIANDLPVSWKEMTVEEAGKLGAMGLFDSKYGEKVKVYSIGDYSKEICGGPHVAHTSQIEKFRIIKEEAVARGIRRIKAVVS